MPPDAELDFLHPLPVERLWGVGKVTAAALHAHGLRHVADVAAQSESDLVALLGSATGRHLHALATGHDPRPVAHRRRRSVGAQHALGRGPHRFEDVDATVQLLVGTVARRLRRGGRAGRTVVLRLRFADYSRATRSRTVGSPTDRTDVLAGTARALLADARTEIDGRGLTLVGVAVTNLDDTGTEQLELPYDVPVPGSAGAGGAAVTHRAVDRHALDAVTDDIHARFGAGALTRAALVGRELRPGTPILPDDR